jgi:hypothetical protein
MKQQMKLRITILCLFLFGIALAGCDGSKTTGIQQDEGFKDGPKGKGPKAPPIPGKPKLPEDSNN